MNNLKQRLGRRRGGDQRGFMPPSIAIPMGIALAATIGIIAVREGSGLLREQQLVLTRMEANLQAQRAEQRAVNESLLLGDRTEPRALSSFDDERAAAAQVDGSLGQVQRSVWILVNPFVPSVRAAHADLDSAMKVHRRLSIQGRSDEAWIYDRRVVTPVFERSIGRIQRAAGWYGDTAVRARIGADAATFAAVMAAILALVVLQRRSDRLRRRFEMRLQHQAFHDELTELPNRRSLMEDLERSLARSARSGARVSVLFLDLDGFKPINDKFGHEGGDEALRVVAERLKSCVRDCDIVARVGGDEFCVVVEDAVADADLQGVAARIIAAMNAPITLQNGVEAELGVSIGSTSSDRTCPTSPTELLRAADEAMYRAKIGGKNRFHAGHVSLAA